LKTTIKQGNKDSRREECRGGNRVKGGLNGREREVPLRVYFRGVYLDMAMKKAVGKKSDV